MFERLTAIFRGSRDSRAWETMPRIGKSFRESRVESLLESLGGPEAIQRLNRVEILITAEDLASNACAFDVPTFYTIQGRACCFLKSESWPDESGDSIAEGIRAGRTILATAYRGFPTYPIVSLLLQIPTDEGTIRLEAAPDIASADIRDSLDILLKVATGDFYWFSGESQLLAKGEFSVSSKVLRRCLEQAARHYKRIPPASLNYLAAVQEYFATTSL